jgi:hypothetical protein
MPCCYKAKIKGSIVCLSMAWDVFEMLLYSAALTRAINSLQ